MPGMLGRFPQVCFNFTHFLWTPPLLLNQTGRLGWNAGVCVLVHSFMCHFDTVGGSFLIPSKDSRELFRKGGRDNQGKSRMLLYLKNIQSGLLEVHGYFNILNQTRCYWIKPWALMHINMYIFSCISSKPTFLSIHLTMLLYDLKISFNSDEAWQCVIMMNYYQKYLIIIL